MKVTIFIKSWLNDLAWLESCLWSLDQHWKEPETEVVVVLDENCRELCQWRDRVMEKMDLHFSFERPWGDGYCHAMYCKTCAERWSKGDYILLTDSDCVLTKDATLEDFMESGRPLITYRTYEEHLAKHPLSPWQKATEKAFRVPTKLHFMARCATLYRRQTFSEMRRYVSGLNQRPYEELVHSDKPFYPENFLQHPITLMDYDFLGFYAWICERGLYSFRHFDECPPEKFVQYHSWTQRPSDVALSGPGNKSSSAENAGSGSSEPPPVEEVTFDHGPSA